MSRRVYMKVTIPRGLGQISHILIEEPISLNKALQFAFSISNEKAEHLLRLGSIYKNEKRALYNEQLEAGTRLRVHQNPLRFNVWNTDWINKIIFQNDYFLVANKPGGIPTHATVDNFVENLKFQLEFHSNQTLYTTHRLDILTQGLIVFAKNNEYLKSFNNLLSKHLVEKIYEAHTREQIPCGLWEHYMKPSPHAPKELSKNKVEGWHKCQLEVLSSEKCNEYYKNTIKLITGRTHQIRAQLAKENAPVIGDPVYGIGFEYLQLFAKKLSFYCPLTQQHYSFILTQ